VNWIITISYDQTTFIQMQSILQSSMHRRYRAQQSPKIKCIVPPSVYPKVLAVTLGALSLGRFVLRGAVNISQFTYISILIFEALFTKILVKVLSLILHLLLPMPNSLFLNYRGALPENLSVRNQCKGRTMLWLGRMN